MSKRLIRVGKVYGRDGPLPVGKTKFYTDFVATGRLHLISLGPRARAVDAAELDAVIQQQIDQSNTRKNGEGFTARKK